MRDEKSRHAKSRSALQESSDLEGNRREGNRREGDRREGNRYPIVLVYGFMGFDANSFVRLPYWGGTVDLEAELRERGFTVYTAHIGPVSSNRDRACELFAAIKGGRVDYGGVHSREAGHTRFGRTYRGVYPLWGTRDPHSGEPRKVHIIGHSMGGQTARLLAHLLENGSEDERAENANDDGKGKEFGKNGKDGEFSPLFEGGRRWVFSVTTLSTPHDGTSLVYRYENMGFVRRLFAKRMAVSSVSRASPFIDLFLDHWDGMRDREESLGDFLKRAVDQELWKELEDFSYYDLSPEGARKLNKIAKASPDIYYFSWANSATEEDPETGRHVPSRGTNIPLHANERFMGSLEDLPEDVPGPASRWWENDGMVNTCSMDGPKLGSSDYIVSYNGTAKRGMWNFMGTFHPFDHWQMHVVAPLIGNPPPRYDSLEDFYEYICSLLWSL